MATQEPVTHVVDAKTMKDPVGDSNELQRQVRQLFDQHPPRERIARAQIYDQATQGERPGVQVERSVQLDTVDGSGSSAQRSFQEDSRNAPDNYSSDPGYDYASLDLSEGSGEQPSSGENIDLGEFLRPTEQQNRQTAGERDTPAQQEVAPGFEQFKKDFETYLGMPLESTVQMVQQLQQFQVQQTAETRLRQIADEWGVNRTEAEARMQTVDERFRKLDPQTRAILSQNPIKGAQLIWQQLEREAYMREPNVPTLDRSGTGDRTVQRPKGSFTKADIAAMDNETYRRMQPAILDAYRRGLVFDY